jgi:hypothetical protein
MWPYAVVAPYSTIHAAVALPAATVAVSVAECAVSADDLTSPTLGCARR